MLFFVASPVGRMMVEVDEGEVLRARLEKLQSASSGPHPLPSGDPGPTDPKLSDGSR